jgi:glycosyltransferase involved in cell wall biosynthesis
VKFLGFIPDIRRVAEVYNASDLFAIPSTAETQSIAAMQGMACGLPVVGVRSWGLKEYITEATGILVDPGDGDALTRALAYLLHHPEVRLRLGSGGREFVTAFSGPAIALEWEETYRQVVERAQQHASPVGLVPARGQRREPAVAKPKARFSASDGGRTR